MAALRFDFSPCKEPALALRIANLITQDIEKLEKAIYGTNTNWQRLEKPFKAHYAIQLVNRIDQPAVRDAILQALPSYEANAANYKKDSKRRGRPLTEYVHSTEANMPTIQASTTAQDNTAPEVDGDQLDDAIRGILEQPDNPGNLAAMVERMRESVQSKPKPEAPDQGEPDASQPQGQTANDGAEDGEQDAPDESNAEQDGNDPLRAAVQAMMEAMNVVQGDALQAPGHVSLDEDRVREIAREEDANLIPVIQAYVDSKLRVNVVRIDRTEQGQVVESVDLGVQHKQFPSLLKLCRVRNHEGFQMPVWLPGPAGSGKTTAARNVAKALDTAFQFTGAVDNPYALLGFRDAAGIYHRTSFREAFECGGVFLWDEVDASNPNALTVFNAALENGVCAFPDGVVSRHKDCIIIAAANTYGHGATHEYVGRNKLDAATVDRFITLDWGYDEQLERALAGDNEWTTYVQKARKACAGAGIKHVISPRASIRGNLLLNDGFTKDEVIAMTVRKGLPDDSWRTITSRMGPDNAGRPVAPQRPMTFKEI